MFLNVIFLVFRSEGRGEDRVLGIGDVFCFFRDLLAWVRFF